MGATADNDYCPNCGSIHCSAACYHGTASSEKAQKDDGGTTGTGNILGWIAALGWIAGAALLVYAVLRG